jgi:cytochrome b561
MNEESDVPQNRSFAIRCYAWSRAIHWVTVALVGGVMFAALFGDIDPRGSGNGAFFWHSSLGLTVYLLSLTRVLLWLVYRPTASSAGKPEAGVHQGLRVAFYAVLIALPISGCWLALEEGVPPHAFGIPALPQWYHREGAAPSVSTHSEVYRGNAAQAAPAVRYLTRLHASLAAALAIIVALHLVSALSARKHWRRARQA